MCGPPLSSSSPPTLAVAPRCAALTSVASCRPTAHTTPHNRPPQSCSGIEHTLTSLPLPPLHSRAQAFDTLTSMASVAAPLPSLLPSPTLPLLLPSTLTVVPRRRTHTTSPPPFHSRAQAFDTLTSMASVAGYRAVIEAVFEFRGFMAGEDVGGGRGRG